jgi:hypothetical protein
MCFSFASTSEPVDGTFVVAQSTGGFTRGSPVRFLGDAGDYLLCVSASSRPKHLILFSPTGDPWKPGTGTTLLFYGGVSRQPGNCDRPPGPVFNATKPSFHMDSLVLLKPIGITRCILSCLAKRSPALQACNRTRNSQADGVPRGTSSAGPTMPAEFFLPLSVAGVHALKTHLGPSCRYATALA